MSASPLPWRYEDGLIRAERGDLIASLESLNHERDNANGALIVAAVNEMAETDAAILAWWETEKGRWDYATDDGPYYADRQAPAFVDAALARRSGT